MKDYRTVGPRGGAAPYLGGKRRLARRLVERIEQIPHETYAEVFVGMGGVFFRRHRAPPIEVINDKSRDVATFFRVLQNHYQAFLDTMKWQLGSRAEFERLKGQDPDRLTDLQRAARFYYLQRQTFGGRPAGHSFGVSSAHPSRFNIVRLASDLEEIHDRLAGVVIECLDWSEFIARYDRPNTLFYLDPPYHGSETDYGKGLFERSDFARMATALAGIKGNFLLSLNDTPEVRTTFAGFHIEEVRLRYSIAEGDATPAAELIISNAAPTARAEAGQGSLI